MSQRNQMKANIGAIIDGSMNDEGIVRTLLATTDDNFTAEQLAGAAEAVMARAVPFPAFPNAIDVCGTGGDYQHTPNISTAVALVVAACGVQVAKHGNRAITSQSGSADVLEALGVKTNLSPEKTEAVLKEVGIAFLFAPSFHPAFTKLGPIRKAIGQRTILNVLGPLCNPAKVDYQLIGVYSSKLVAPVAGACNLLGRKRVMVVHGDDGADELSITGPSQVAELVGSAVTMSTLEPKRAGLRTYEKKYLQGGDARDNAKLMLDILGGEENAYSQAVVLNAAAALVVAGKAGAMRGGATMAADALASGEARKKLIELAAATHRPEKPAA